MFLKQIIYNIINIVMVFSTIKLLILSTKSSDIRFIIGFGLLIIYLDWLIIKINKSWFRKQVLKKSEKIFNEKKLQLVKEKNNGSLQEEELALLPLYRKEYENQKEYKIKKNINTFLEGTLVTDVFNLTQVKVNVDYFEYKMYFRKGRKRENYHNIKGEAFVLEYQNINFSTEPCVFYSFAIGKKKYYNIFINKKNFISMDTGLGSLFFEEENERERKKQLEIINLFVEKIPNKYGGIIMFNKNRLIYVTNKKYNHELKVKVPFLITPISMRKIFKEQEQDIESFNQMINEIASVANNAFKY